MSERLEQAAFILWIVFLAMCGAEDWSRARPNEEHEIVMCNKCPGLEDWCPLETVQ